MNRQYLISEGRSTGLKAVTKRLSELNIVAKQKKLQFNWENRGTYYDLYIENENNEKIWEETVLTRGTRTTVKINNFLEIIEKELEKR